MLWTVSALHIFNVSKTDSDMHTTYIINLKSKFNFVTYTNSHSGLIKNKATMNNYETTVSAKRVWTLYCIQGAVPKAGETTQA